MRGITTPCQDCGESNGGHRLDCAGRIPCDDCGGKHHAHTVQCSHFNDYLKVPQLFGPGSEITVHDYASPFHGWKGSVTAIEEVGLGRACWYRCLVNPPVNGPGWDMLDLVFNQSQLCGEVGIPKSETPAYEPKPRLRRGSITGTAEARDIGVARSGKGEGGAIAFQFRCGDRILMKKDEVLKLVDAIMLEVGNMES